MGGFCLGNQKMSNQLTTKVGVISSRAVGDSNISRNHSLPRGKNVLDKGVYVIFY